MKNRSTIIVLFLLATCDAFGTIYQWQDKNGITHYGQHPPADATVTEISIPTSGPSSSAAQEKTHLENLIKSQEEAVQNAQVAKEKAQRQEKEAKLRAINCERAKAHLENIESRVRIRMQDASGNVTQLTPEQRDEDIARTKAAIQEYCHVAPKPPEKLGN